MSKKIAGTMDDITLKRLAAERGSILPLVSLFVTLGLLVVLVSTSAVSLYLERKKLFSLADGAALFAAEAFTVNDANMQDGRFNFVLEDDAVGSAARAYLGGLDISHERLLLVSAHSPDQRSARIVLQSSWRPPILTLFVPEGIEIQVEATARVVFSGDGEY
ncbi:MAG: pilus assembly protein TadG-related protein [Microbacteriaceae bacterium]